MTDGYMNSTRLTQRQRRELLESLEQSTSDVAESRRQHERLDCHIPEAPLAVTHPDGQVARFLVCTRNISSGGLAFLHGGFLYPGCRCEITLPTVWGGQETLIGAIVTCRHVDKHIHEFSLCFAELIDTRRFITPPGERPLVCEPDNSKIEALTGSVLMVDKSIINVDLARYHIKGANVEIHAAETIREGIVSVRSSPIDVILLDIDQVDRTPGELILEYRDAGFKGPIVCTTTTPDSDLSQAALAAGADEVISRPVSASNLVRVLSECLSGCAGASGPVRSQLECSPDTVELINNYLNYIESLAMTLSEGIETEDLDQILSGCRGIAQSAGGYGFPTLEQAAKDAEQALQDSCSVTESLQELQRLRSVCARLEPLTLS